ncbi:MAG: hypothetical protein IPP71_22255 [Bacteroidetes bacterium]|nr:hypothetical protein [Bacteroidota bacterium]
MSSQTYNLDLDGDGTTDFVIRAARANFTPLSLTLSYVGVTPQEAVPLLPQRPIQLKVFLGDSISSSQAWHDSTLQYLKRYQQSGSSTPTNTGEWDSVVDGYVGLQLINGSQIYYGWVENGCNCKYVICINDY